MIENKSDAISALLDIILSPTLFTINNSLIIQALKKLKQYTNTALILNKLNERLNDSEDDETRLRVLLALLDLAPNKPESNEIIPLKSNG